MDEREPGYRVPGQPPSVPPELPAFPLSEAAQGELFEILAGYSRKPLPEWALCIRLGRLVSVPPWALHRCPQDWLEAALEVERVEREVADHLLRKQSGARDPLAG